MSDFALFVTSLRRVHRDVVARVAAEMIAAPAAASLETATECAWGGGGASAAIHCACMPPPLRSMLCGRP